MKGDEEKTLRATLHSPNDNLKVTEKGTYEIIGIDDILCPGTVLADAATYQVDWIPQPSAKLSPSTVAQHDSYNGSYILPSICEGVSDHVDLDLTGRPPFQIMYNIAQDNDVGGTKLVGQPTFNSIQPRTRFQLQTSAPGRMYYEVKQIGDAAYPLMKHKNAIIPRSERLLFEQHVMKRPSVRFRNRNRMTYCQNDALTPLDPSSNDGILLFEGTPPFTLTLTVKDIAASHTEAQTIEVHDQIWKLSLPSYRFKSIGPYLVTIESVTDASKCAQSALDPMFSSIWIDVAETAAIIPFEKRENICVGDVAQFQLEGIPPWTVGCVLLSVSSFVTLTDSYKNADIASTAKFTLKRSRPRLSRYSNLNLGSWLSLPLRTNRRCARPLLQTSDTLSTPCLPLKLAMGSASSKTFTKVCAVHDLLIFESY